MSRRDGSEVCAGVLRSLPCLCVLHPVGSTETRGRDGHHPHLTSAHAQNPKGTIRTTLFFRYLCLLPTRSKRRIRRQTAATTSNPCVGNLRGPLPTHRPLVRVAHSIAVPYSHVAMLPPQSIAGPERDQKSLRSFSRTNTRLSLTSHLNLSFHFTSTLRRGAS